jgi:hypothetical protein
MSRPRTPLAVLEGRGSIKKNPQRYRDRLAAAAAATASGGVGPPPERWNIPIEEIGGPKFARWRAIWEEFAPQVPPDTPMKRALLELFCEAMDKFRTAGMSMKASEKTYLLQLAKVLGTDSRGSSGAEKPQGFGGPWEAFG